MSKFQSESTRLSAGLYLSALLGLGGLLPMQDASGQVCSCNGGGLATSISVTPTISHVGDTVTISQIGAVLGSLNNCFVTNGIAYIMYPNGNTSTANLLATGNAPGANGQNGLQEYELHFNMNGATPLNPC